MLSRSRTSLTLLPRDVGVEQATPRAVLRVQALLIHLPTQPLSSIDPASHTFRDMPADAGSETYALGQGASNLLVYVHARLQDTDLLVAITIVASPSNRLYLQASLKHCCDAP